jgi:hypothetical protein
MYLGKTKLGVADRNGFHRPLKEGEANWFQRLGRHFWIGSIIVMILVGLSITLLVGYLVALSTPFFRLEDVNFQGNKQVSQVELLQKGGLEDKLNIRIPDEELAGVETLGELDALIRRVIAGQGAP